MFSDTTVNVGEIDEAFQELGSKYSLWLITVGHSIKLYEERKVFEVRVPCFTNGSLTRVLDPRALPELFPEKGLYGAT